MKINNKFINKYTGLTVAAVALAAVTPAIKPDKKYTITKDAPVALSADTFESRKDTFKLSAEAFKNTSADVFEIDKDSMVIPPQGTSYKGVLLNAPSPKIKVCGKDSLAAIVVDLSKNVLYKYDDKGEPKSAYLVASGKKRYPTDKGLRIVSHVESYPYKSAPPSTKRHRKPWDYGPRAIILEILDPETGEKSRTGEFIHGNNNPSSIGQYASLGCIRMDNEVIKKLAKQVKRGDLVLIQ